MKCYSTAFSPVNKTLLMCACMATLLSACSGGSESSPNKTSAQQVESKMAIASGATTLQLGAVSSSDDAVRIAQPAYHLAPLLLDAPEDVDVIDNAASARMSARRQWVPDEFRAMQTRGLTVQALHAAREYRLAHADGLSPDASGSNAVITYSPAQIRAAYNLPALPVSGAMLTTAQAAQLGAGQTIYLIDAMSDPNITAELAAFSQKFGLPSCSTQAISTNTALPLASPSATSCSFSVINSTYNATMTTAAPAYDAGWATEMALDVEWAHATAPSARIILINAPDASNDGLLGAINLANAMGAGIVSMSFGTQEGNWTSSVNSVFTNQNMTYLASAGDSGPSVQWPAVSPNVVAVGGTSLTYNGSGTRSEVTWSKTGGGISQFTPTPSYQNNTVPDLGNLSHRSVSDVAFNADPNTGQYVAVITPGSTNVNWGSVGGTSVGAPQWAGIFAVANAVRASVGKSALGDPHAVIYGQISAIPGTYASAFADITIGSDGNCSTCTAKVGYDQVTGLGTPNVSSLLTTLSGVSAAATAPVVTSATISGTVGTALSFTISQNDVNAVTYSLSGAPSGMTVNNSGAVTWPTPVIGSHAVTVTVKDSKTGLSGTGIYTVVIVAQSAPIAPIVNGGSINGKVGTVLSFSAAVADTNPVTYSLTGAPTGMVISSTGTVTWATPVAGNYGITVTAKDSKTGLSGRGVFTVTIAAAGTISSGPVITAAPMNGIAGQRLSGSIGISDAGVSWVSISISGAPMGMMFSASGLTVQVNWPNPVAGTNSMKVSVTDSAGHNTQATIPITITAH